MGHFGTSIICERQGTARQSCFLDIYMQHTLNCHKQSPRGSLELMPQVCIDLWQKVWCITPDELGGTRAYITDFERYDERAQDSNNTILDLCIGID